MNDKKVKPQFSKYLTCTYFSCNNRPAVAVCKYYRCILPLDEKTNYPVRAENPYSGHALCKQHLKEVMNIDA